jgi:hypothetical protein
VYCQVGRRHLVGGVRRAVNIRFEEHVINYIPKLSAINLMMK